MKQTDTADSRRLAALLDDAQRLYDDLAYSSVSQWKAREPGRVAIGFLPIYAPREIVHACGALPIGLMGGSDRLEIVRGDSYFQSYICHLPRSVVELAVSGRLDCFDGFLFPSTCDVIRNLSGMFKIFFPDKYVHYLDLPQNLIGEAGARFYREDLRQMAVEIGALSGVRVNDERLRDSIGKYNLNRAALRRLWEYRRTHPHRVPTTEYYLLMRAGLALPVEEHTAMLDDYLRVVAELQRREMDNIRVLVRGAFCEQPPLALLRTLERAGCYVVDDDFVQGARFIPGRIDENGDPWDALARAFIHDSLPSAVKYDAHRTKAQDLVNAAREAAADGVILMAPSFCDPALLEQPMLQRALEEASIPFTIFKYSEDTGQFQVIREQAGTFADAIKLWGAST